MTDVTLAAFEDIEPIYDGVVRPYGVIVFACDSEHIRRHHRIPQPELFQRLGLPDRSHPST